MSLVSKLEHAPCRLWLGQNTAAKHFDRRWNDHTLQPCLVHSIGVCRKPKRIRIINFGGQGLSSHDFRSVAWPLQQSLCAWLIKRTVWRLLAFSHSLHTVKHICTKILGLWILSTSANQFFPQVILVHTHNTPIVSFFTDWLPPSFRLVDDHTHTHLGYTFDDDDDYY